MRLTLKLGALLLGSSLVVACPDAPPPAPYQKPLPRRPKRTVTAPKPLPPLDRPQRQAKPEDPLVVARRECGEVYRQRRRSNEQVRRLLAKTSKGTVVPKMPPREEFVASCAILPLDMIRCMNPQKAAKTGVDCLATLSKLDAKALEKLRAASKGKRRTRRKR